MKLINIFVFTINGQLFRDRGSFNNYFTNFVCMIFATFLVNNLVNEEKKNIAPALSAPTNPNFVFHNKLPKSGISLKFRGITLQFRGIILKFRYIPSGWYVSFQRLFIKITSLYIC